MITPTFKIRFILLLTSVMVFPGCGEKKSFIVEGSAGESTQKKIFIKKININTPVLLDSSDITGKGNFRFKIKAREPDYYQVGYSDANFVTLLAEPGEKIKLKFPGENLYKDYSVSGSHGSELVRTLDLRLLQTKTILDSLSILYNNASGNPDFGTRGALIEQEYEKVIKEQRRSNIEFIITNISSLAAIKALYQKFDDQSYVLYEPRDLQYLKIVADSLKVHYPESRHTKALVGDLEKELNQFYARQLEQIASTLPETRLDPSLKDINGKRVTLSSLKGRYVLLTFWSAESRECITDNLQMKEYYRIYNRRGFEIYQISVDKDEEKWKAAVKFDELPWISTREDDPENPVNARLYNVTRLPANFLYSPEGEIIATSLHGRNLQIKLNQLFK